MKAVKTIVALVLVFGSCLIYTSLRAEDPNPKPEKAKLRVGTFDSRAIVIAYAHSAEFNQSLKKLMAEHDKAKADGDDKKAKELEEKGKSGQQMFHMQGFSIAPVNDILEHIKDKIPGIAKEAGVDVIVSKWEVVYQSPDAEFVDITDLMVKPFNPNEKTMSTLKELGKHPPIPLQEAMDIND
jgi:Skp family chaperone for outer membrane proteins